MADTRSDVVVVDDDASVLKSLERLLRSSGLRLRTFASAVDYLDACLTPDPGCLLLDIRMPDLNGLELQERLRRVGSRIPIIFMTAHEDPQARMKALAGGAVAVLQKPFDERMLLEAVFNALGRTP